MGNLPIIIWLLGFLLLMHFFIDLPLFIVVLHFVLWGGITLFQLRIKLKNQRCPGGSAQDETK